MPEDSQDDFDDLDPLGLGSGDQQFASSTDHDDDDEDDDEDDDDN